METEVEVDGVHPVEGDGDGKKIIKLRCYACEWCWREGREGDPRG